MYIGAINDLVVSIPFTIFKDNIVKGVKSGYLENPSL